MPTTKIQLRLNQTFTNSDKNQITRKIEEFIRECWKPTKCDPHIWDLEIANRNYDFAKRLMDDASQIFSLTNYRIWTKLFQPELRFVRTGEYLETNNINHDFSFKITGESIPYILLKYNDNEDMVLKELETNEILKLPKEDRLNHWKIFHVD